jgi:colicin import membrane protein
MSAHNSPQTISLGERSIPFTGREEKLSRWLLFSFLFHGVLIAGLFVVPFLPVRSGLISPVYTVDLVGGEKIGATNLGTELVSSGLPKAPPKRTTEEVLPPAGETKTKPNKEKPKTVEKEPLVQEKVILKDTTNKSDLTKKEPTKETRNESNTEESALDRVRERLMQSAVDRAKNRAEGTQKGSKGDVISAGPGEGEGAAALGPGGRGGGVVKGMEFIIYQNRMLSSIKDNWAWVGQKSNLKVVVHFSIRENGEITGLKVVQPSGDLSYDESVLRAVKKSSPLPPPPESARRDFADVELTFRPTDLGA